MNTSPQTIVTTEPPIHEPAAIKSEPVLLNNVSPTHQVLVTTTTTPASPPVINSTPMIPQTPSIQPPTTAPVAVASPAPCKHRMHFTYRKHFKHFERLSTTNKSRFAFLVPEKRRSVKSISSSKKSKKHRQSQQTTTKDLGRWKPIDDLSLIIGIQQTNDLKIVHQGVKFSCKFTIQELQSRWYSLLYDEPISRIAVAAMRNLHPEIVESVHSKALYTAQEEELLGTIKSVMSQFIWFFFFFWLVG